VRALSRSFLCALLAWTASCSREAPQEQPPAAPKAAEAKDEDPPPKTAPPEAQRTESGIAYLLLEPGSGDERPELHDKVRVRFTTWSKGKRVDSDGAVVFDMQGVIAGWTEALQAMRVGEKRRLWIPDRLVYPGRSGYPRADSVFEIELVEVIDGRPPLPAPADVAAVPVDAIETASGLAYKWLARGHGTEKRTETPNAWDRVTIHFTGWTSDGAMFESSRQREQPGIFDLAEVMPGWREGLPLLAVGDQARFWIPEPLAYQGKGGKPKGTLVFDIELLSITRKPEPPRPPADVASAPHDAKKTKTGLAYRLLERGQGTATPSANDHVEVQYSAWTSDGTLFDSSVVRGRPAKLPVSQLIKGWAEGLQLMHEGDKALLWIPEKLAYAGRDGSPRGMLVYEVQLLKVLN
jgi:FKBP-type peptidyl-prolyl cis-trans isomerase